MIKSTEIQRPYPLGHGGRRDEATEDNDDDCGMIGCKQPHRDNWLRCEVCWRWCHFVCANIKTRQSGGGGALSVSSARPNILMGFI